MAELCDDATEPSEAWELLEYGSPASSSSVIDIAESGLLRLVMDDRLLMVDWGIERCCAGSCGTAGTPDEWLKYSRRAGWRPREGVSGYECIIVEMERSLFVLLPRLPLRLWVGEEAIELGRDRELGVLTV